MKFTGTNQFAMRETFGDKTEVPNRIPAARVPHIRRCVKMGFVEIDGAVIRMTPAGIEACK